MDVDPSTPEPVATPELPSEVTGEGGGTRLLSEVAGAEEALAALSDLDPWILETQAELTAIPAPPFGEGPRGQRMAEHFLALGLRDVRVDEVGNVLAYLPDQGATPGKGHGLHDSGDRRPPFILAAHLDTVFPAGTEVLPRRSGGVIRAPGISDDGRGLAALLAVARVLSEVDLPHPFPLLFAATVGEEGEGNLRGVRHLFREGGPGTGAQGFVSLDGVGLDRIISKGVGSTRLRVVLRGPGGHSWTDWGLPNPIHALGRIVAAVEDRPLPPPPKTTATVARWGGGRSINAIPQEAWVELDLRSEEGAVLEELERKILRLCSQEAALPREGGEEDVRPALALEITELGRRPPGETSPDSVLVRAAVRATRLLDVEPSLSASSTDANLPMSLDIPAVTLGAGGKAGGIHTLDEWYENWRGPEGILRALLTLALLD